MPEEKKAEMELEVSFLGGLQAKINDRFGENRCKLLKEEGMTGILSLEKSSNDDINIDPVNKLVETVKIYYESKGYEADRGEDNDHLVTVRKGDESFKVGVTTNWSQFFGIDVSRSAEK